MRLTTAAVAHGPQARLVETGAKKLAQLFTKLVAEGSSGVTPNGPEFSLSPFPQNLKPTLIPLVTFLRTLPLPPTHPNHPAASSIQSTLKEAQRGYADMRGSWGKKCLENYARRVVDRAETIDGVAAGREFGSWVANLLAVAEVRVVCCSSSRQLRSMFGHRRNTNSCWNSHLFLVSK